jgi:hypothetical protein
MKKVLLVVSVLAVLSAVSFGGWEHLSTRGTFWTDSPTAATCFLRDNKTGDVCPALRPSVYANTICLATNTLYSQPPSYGLFTVDLNGDYMPIADICTMDVSNAHTVVGWRVDVEFTVNTNLDLVLKD